MNMRLVFALDFLRIMTTCCVLLYKYVIRHLLRWTYLRTIGNVQSAFVRYLAPGTATLTSRCTICCYSKSRHQMFTQMFLLLVPLYWIVSQCCGWCGDRRNYEISVRCWLHQYFEFCILRRLTKNVSNQSQVLVSILSGREIAIRDAHWNALEWKMTWESDSRIDSEFKKKCFILWISLGRCDRCVSVCVREKRPQRCTHETETVPSYLLRWPEGQITAKPNQ